MIDLILGGKSNALWVSRALGHDNINSYLLDCDITPCAGYSIYIDKQFYLENDIKLLVNFIRKKCGEAKIILYPTSDFWIEFILNNEEYLHHNGFVFFKNKPDLIKAFLDKLAFYDTFSDKYDIPKTVRYNAKIQTPYIVKPRKSFQGKECISKGFEQHKKGIISKNYFIKQQLVKASLAHHYSVSGISIKGHLHAVIVTRKVLEYPSPGGTATMIATVECHETKKNLIEIARDFLRHTQYSGAFEIEILNDQKQFWLLEINARFWLQHAMPLSQGINFSKIYRDALLENLQESSINIPLIVEENAIWLHEALLISFIKASFSDKFTVIKLILNRHYRMSFGYFSMNDIKPFLNYIKSKILK